MAVRKTEGRRQVLFLRVLLLFGGVAVGIVGVYALRVLPRATHTVVVDDKVVDDNGRRGAGLSSPARATAEETMDAGAAAVGAAGLAAEYEWREPSEWQGMLLNRAFATICETSGGCGLAMACRGGRCGPCETDSQCAPGEVCSVQHCIQAHLAECRSRRDCPGDEAFCILSGYTADVRGNGSMRAYCTAAGDWGKPLDEEGEREVVQQQDARTLEAREVVPGSAEDLRRRLAEGR